MPWANIGTGGGSGGGGGTGTVTSVALTLPADLSVSGSPVTTSGTLAAAWAAQTTNKVLSAPSGSTGTPTFRALLAADIPNLDAAKVTTGTLSADRLPAIPPSSVSPQTSFGLDLGDSSDGSVTLDGTTAFNDFSTLSGGVYTLTRSVYFSNLTVNAGVTLWSPGYRVFVRNTLQIAATGAVTADGAAGVFNSGTVVTAPAGGDVAGGSPTVLGGAASTTTGAAGAIPAATALGCGGVGGTGGTGGRGSTNGTTLNTVGGVGRPGSVFTAQRFFRVLNHYLTFGGALIGGGSPGGGAGAGGGCNTHPSGRGGQGGAGGGVLFLAANTVVNNGRISANGGAGSLGSSPTSVVNSANGAGGGGGGGGGGWVYYAFGTMTGSGVVQAAGGAGGLGGTGLQNGTYDQALVDGGAGSAGNAGLVLAFDLTQRAWVSV